MFTSNDVYSRLKVVPFVPFEVVTSSGESYEVRHPEMALVGRRDVIIGILPPDGSQFHDQSARISIMHITAMKDLAVPASSSGNGHGS